MREPQEGDRLVCPKCPATVEVSVEDPDASWSDMVNHIRPHADYNEAQVRNLLVRVKLVDASGQQVYN